MNLVDEGKKDRNGYHKRNIEQFFRGSTQIEGEWVKPEEKTTLSLADIDKRIGELRQELSQLTRQKKDLEDVDRMNAIFKVRRLMEAYNVTPEELVDHRRRNRPTVAAQSDPIFSRKKTTRPDKYRMGANGWCGVGKPPYWVREVIEAEGKEGLEKYRVDLH